MSASRLYRTRPVTAADEPFLWEMLYEAIFVPEGKRRLEREIVAHPDLAKYLVGWGRPDDDGFLAIESASHDPVGAAWFRRFTADDPGYGYVDDDTPEITLAILPAHRGRGVGTFLLRHLLAEAKDRYPALSLSVSVENPARRLYERLVFVPVETRGSSLVMKTSFPVVSPKR